MSGRRVLLGHVPVLSPSSRRLTTEDIGRKLALVHERMPPVDVSVVETAEDRALAAVLHAELRDWDIEQVRALGMDAQTVADFYYSAGSGDEDDPFAPPAGLMLLARRGPEAAGCAGFRASGDGVCELKRMYVRPAHRTQGIGELLLRRALDEARAAGYRRMRLETVTFMPAAIALYRRHGFMDLAPYYRIPDGFESITRFLERPL